MQLLFFLDKSFKFPVVGIFIYRAVETVSFDRSLISFFYLFFFLSLFYSNDPRR